MMLLSNCVVCYSTKLRFIKEQEVIGLLLRTNFPFTRISLIGIIFQKYKMNEILNTFFYHHNKYYKYSLKTE